MSISTLESPQSVRMLDEAHRRDDAQKRAEADLAFDFEKAIEAGDPDATPSWTGTVPDTTQPPMQSGYRLRRRVTVAEALEDSLGYPSGPGVGDVVKVLSAALRCQDPLVGLAARQLVQRAAFKFAEFHCPEVDA